MPRRRIKEVLYQNGTVVATPNGVIPCDMEHNRVMQLRYADGSVWNILAAEYVYQAG